MARAIRWKDQNRLSLAAVRWLAHNNGRMATYTVSIQASDPRGQTLNLNVQVEAENVLQALELARPRLQVILEAGGLQVKPTAEAAPPTEPA